ncbi:hypothetical protein L211DRAFT_854571 [Terfezia boudieri ATCC MYA-4762]|uniref:Uncharacterized protein n=1 Tax=Terfezia boudieri ATCC MYA-4762 TaxID=1051890 RepID=A0A3N4L524_9PEZI|nr:hypothetical protein L211DRAFT_854571 [Terfezia boudieri ATCC MYA-4762]
MPHGVLATRYRSRYPTLTPTLTPPENGLGIVMRGEAPSTLVDLCSENVTLFIIIAESIGTTVHDRTRRSMEIGVPYPMVFWPHAYAYAYAYVYAYVYAYAYALSL